MVCYGTHPQPVDSVGQSGVRRGREAHVAVLVAVATPGAADVQVQQWADRQTDGSAPGQHRGSAQGHLLVSKQHGGVN